MMDRTVARFSQSTEEFGARFDKKKEIKRILLSWIKMLREYVLYIVPKYVYVFLFKIIKKSTYTLKTHKLEFYERKCLNAQIKYFICI